MESVDLHISPRVKESFVFKTPCAFSPTGEHYVRMMLGRKKTSICWLSLGCECVDKVPADTLDGMMTLATLDGQTPSMCAATLAHVKALLLKPAGQMLRSEDVRTLPALVAGVVSSVRAMQLTRTKRADTVAVPSVEDRTAKRWQYIFNKAAGTSPLAFKIRFDHTRRVYGLYNRLGNVIAYRLAGQWCLQEGWERRAKRWADYMDDDSPAEIYVEGDKRAQCTFCGGVYDPRNYRRNGGHDAFQNASHVAGVVLRLKVGLVATRNFPVVEEITRAPKSLVKYPEVQVLRPEDWDAVFVA